MANYLERVASSAGRRAAIAKPPASGPPVLPAGRDFSMASEASFASDDEQFDSLETHTPARTAERAEIPSAPKVETERELKTAVTHDEILDPPIEPRPKLRPAQERLSSDSPFTVHVPRTLRPSATSQIAPTAPDEPPREQTRVRASTTVRSEEATITEEPIPLVRSTDSVVNKIKQPVTAETDTTVLTPQPGPPVADRDEPHQAPKPVHAEPARSDITPIPRVDRVDGPARYSAEPSPPPAMPVNLPPVTGSATRQEQSRVHIGSLEVLVNNHPRVPTARPAPQSSRSERLNLEKRYLDRFRLRH